MARATICDATRFDEKSRRADPFSNIRVVRLPKAGVPIGEGNLLVRGAA